MEVGWFRACNSDTHNIFLIVHCQSNIFENTSLPKFEGTCTVYLVDTRYARDNPNAPKGYSDTSVSCITPDGLTHKIPSMDKDYIQQNFIKGPFRSGRTELVIDSTSDATINPTTGTIFVLPDKVLLRELKSKQQSKTKATTGTKSILVVRVIASDDTTTPSVNALSDSVFGTSGDSVNLKSQFSACSHNKLNFVPATGSGITNGVRQVTVSTSTSQGDDAMNNAILSALGGESTAYGLADYLMFCLPPGTMSGIAYAYIDGQLSVYDDWWCTYPSVGLHELGHNLGT